MCKLCDEGNPQNHSRSSRSRRDFFKATAAAGVAAAGFNPFAARPAAADGGGPPADRGPPGRRYVIRGGAVAWVVPEEVGVSPRARVWRGERTRPGWAGPNSRREPR